LSNINGSTQKELVSENAIMPESSAPSNGEELPKTGENFSNTARATGLLAILTSIFGFLFKRNRKDKDQ
jgi:LPXTG-motif cell wall-anchored protein